MNKEMKAKIRLKIEMMRDCPLPDDGDNQTGMQPQSCAAPIGFAAIGHAQGCACKVNYSELGKCKLSTCDEEAVENAEDPLNITCSIENSPYGTPCQSKANLCANWICDGNGNCIALGSKPDGTSCSKDDCKICQGGDCVNAENKNCSGCGLCKKGVCSNGECKCINEEDNTICASLTNELGNVICKATCQNGICKLDQSNTKCSTKWCDLDVNGTCILENTAIICNYEKPQNKVCCAGKDYNTNECKCCCSCGGKRPENPCQPNSTACSKACGGGDKNNSNPICTAEK